MSSIMCSVRASLQQYCVVHGKTRAECCEAAFNLYPPPSSDKDRRMWLKGAKLEETSEKALRLFFSFCGRQTIRPTPIPREMVGICYSSDEKGSSYTCEAPRNTLNQYCKPGD
ncbi:hypothetical protein AALO_G00273400 [Alosa alosa]|uniref:Uncharacterized protein n=1 Tax=Alosa alosa TaxID=278164 RepID=A0AAV6FKT8_9TELE|nr:hypothetical protein AALO_G00273400 [Alosa alosa]